MRTLDFELKAPIPDCSEMPELLVARLRWLLVVAYLLTGSLVGVSSSLGQGEVEEPPLPAPTSSDVGFELIALATPALNPPGARALGMGAAFIGLADDATAAEANPAGLTTLTRPEFSINFRSVSRSTEALDPFPVVFERSAGFQDTTSGPSFISYARPLSKKRMSFSIYYQSASDFKSNDQFSNGIETSFSDFEMHLEHLGLSFAYRITDRLSLGLSIRYSLLDADLLYQSIDFVIDEQEQLFEDFTSPFLDRFVTLEEVVRDKDEELTIAAGLLINPGGRLSVGAVYRQGGGFELEFQQTGTFFFPAFDDLLIESDSGLQPTESNLPDAYGLGLAYRPNSNWIVGLDVIRVEYSDTQSRFADTGATPDDETEIHLGLEYGFTLGAKNTPFFVRAGYYNSPDHDASSLIDSEQNFMTVGAGVFLKEKLQLDGALAVSEDVTEALVSMVWRL